MDLESSVRLAAPLERKSAKLPVYVVVPGATLEQWGLLGTTVLEGTANGKVFGRRTIKHWGKGSDAWFIELTAEFCKRAGLVVGDAVELELSLADMSTSPEVDCLLSESAELTERWLALTDRERRELGERIREVPSVFRLPRGCAHAT